MTKNTQRASLVALLTTISGAAAAQYAPPPSPPAPAVAPAAAPAPPPGAPPPAPAMGPPMAPAPGQPPPPLAPSPMYEPPPPPRPIEYGAPPPPPMRPSGSQAYVGDAMVGFAWDLGIPIGSIHQFTSNVSGLGFDISFRYWVHKQISIGGDVDWQTFTDNKPRTTYPITNGAVTATAYNSLQQAALRVGGQYYFVDDGPILPYVGLNIGYGWGTFQSAAADLILYDNQDSVILGAELGTVLALSPRAPLITVAGRYSAAPAMEFLNSVKDVQTITFQLGLLLY